MRLEIGIQIDNKIPIPGLMPDDKPCVSKSYRQSIQEDGVAVMHICMSNC